MLDLTPTLHKVDMPVPARYYARLAEVIARDGIDLASLLRSLRFSPRVFAEPDATLPFSKVDMLVRRVVEISDRSDLGFELGKLLTASAHSFVGFGMLNSANLDQSLRFESQYFRLVMPSFRMRYTSGPDFGDMHFAPVIAMSPLCLAFHLEAIGMAALREVSDLTGDHRPPCRLDLSIPEPPHRKRYGELRDVQVRFGADTMPSVRLRLLADPRAYPLTMADSNARGIAEKRCRALVQQTASMRQFSDWVAMTLHEVADGVPTLEELAATLSMSKRTLNRYLEREGTSFRELSGRIQHQLACERLAGGGMSVTEVAYSLGFSDLSNFARAFRAREGQSPRQYQLRQSTKSRKRS